MSCLPGLGKVGGVVDDETESCNPPGLANVGLKRQRDILRNKAEILTSVNVLNCECFLK